MKLQYILSVFLLALTLNVGAQAGLFLQSTTATSGGGGGLWTPENINTLAWYDASDESTLTLIGNNVETWAEKKGNTIRNLSQSTSSSQPVYDSMNDEVQFDGIDDYLTNTNPFMYDNGSVEVFVVAKVNGTAGDRRLLSESNIANNTPLYDIFTQAFTAPSRMAGFMRTDGNIIILSTNVPLSSSVNDIATRILYVRIDKGNLIEGWTNGDDFYQVAYSRSGSLTTTNFSLGAIVRTSVGFWMEMKVSEIIITDVQTDAMREIIEGYLAHKWGIESNLPAAHPYKLAAPQN